MIAAGALLRAHRTAAALAFVLVAAVAIPPFLASYWVFLATAGMLTAITALGLAVIIGWVGEVTLAAGALLGTSVYVTGYLVREGSTSWNNQPFLLAALAGIVCAAVLSALVAIPTARFSGMYVLVLTLGLQITVERTLFSQPWIIGGFGRNVVVTRPEVAGFSFDTDLRFFYLTLIAAVGAGLFVHALRKSRHGRAMNLVRTDGRAAAAVGVNPWRYKVLAFAVGGALIGLAGAFQAPLYRSPPAIIGFTAFQSLFLLAVPVVAGTQSILAIGVVAISFAIIPTYLEDHSLSVLLLGGVGLLLGTLVGPRGMGSLVLEPLQRRREEALLRAARAGTPEAPPAPDETRERHRAGHRERPPLVLGGPALAAPVTGSGTIDLRERPHPAWTEKPWTEKPWSEKPRSEKP